MVIDQAVLSALVQAAGLALIAGLQKQADARRESIRAESESERAERRDWRERVDMRLERQDKRLETVISTQCTLMRTDLIHKAHRYIDDLGCAGVEEKQAFWAEYEEYQAICEENDFVNHFVDHLSKQVMALPDRPQNGQFRPVGNIEGS